TEIDPFTGEKIFVEKDFNRKQRQKDILTTKGFYKASNNQKKSSERNSHHHVKGNKWQKK
ncbi:MAG: hypothetical protein ACRC37_06940, partial [Lentisphaeria bacterium]